MHLVGTRSALYIVAPTFAVQNVIGAAARDDVCALSALKVGIEAVLTIDLVRPTVGQDGVSSPTTMNSSACSCPRSPYEGKCRHCSRKSGQPRQGVGRSRRTPHRMLLLLAACFN